MKALILAGGEATRLRPLSCNLPKAMMPVLNTPFLEHVIRHLGEHNIKDIILTLGVLPKSIEQYFGDGSQFGVRIFYIIEDRPLGTAGAIKNAEKELDDTFLALNGDVFTDLDFTSMIKEHRAKKASTTISTTPVEDPVNYGLIETTDSGRITRFLEKPSPEQITTNMINAGTYVIEPEILSVIQPQTRVSIEREIFPLLLEKGEPVYAFPSEAYWIDIGTPDKYLKLHSDLLNSRIGKEVNTGGNCNIHTSAQIKGPVLIGDYCRIGRNVKLTGPLVIGPCCEIMPDSEIAESVIWRDVRIGPQAKIHRSIVANDCCIDDNCIIESSVIGDNVNVPCGSRLVPGTKIWPPGSSNNNHPG